MSDLLFSVFPNENFVDLGLYQYGWEQCAPAHSFGPAARNHYIFHYVISGEKYIFPVTDIPDIHFSYFLIPMVVLDILMIVAFFLSFFMAKRRADKEKIHE